MSPLRPASAWALALVLAGAAGGARAAREPAPVPGELERLGRELSEVERRLEATGRGLAVREAHLRARLRLLYELSAGGSLRRLLVAGSREELLGRQALAGRIVARDLQELRAHERERAALTLDRDSLVRARAAGPGAGVADAQAPRLARPVGGALSGRFGRYVDPATGTALVRRGVELVAPRGTPVRAPAAGIASLLGELRGVGRLIAVDRGDGVVALVGRLGEVVVRDGARVAAGAPLGVAAGPTVYYEVRVRGAAVDPLPR